MLDAAHKVDSYIQRLWEMVQTMPAYRNKTTFIIATDHGRGLRPACLARSRQGSGRRGKHLDRRDRPRHAAVGRTDKLCASYTKPDRRHGCGIVG